MMLMPTAVHARRQLPAIVGWHDRSRPPGDAPWPERVSDEMLNDAGIDLRKTGTPSVVKPKRRPAPASALTSPAALRP